MVEEEKKKYHLCFREENMLGKDIQVSDFKD
jgi:hypothetical protein